MTGQTRIPRPTCSGTLNTSGTPVLRQHRHDAELPAVRKAEPLRYERAGQLETEDARAAARPEREGSRAARRNRAPEENRTLVRADGDFYGSPLR